MILRRKLVRIRKWAVCQPQVLLLLKLFTVTKGIFHQSGTVLRHWFINFLLSHYWQKLLVLFFLNWFFFQWSFWPSYLRIILCVNHRKHLLQSLYIYKNLPRHEVIQTTWKKTDNGGGFLHAVVWKPLAVFGETLQQFVSYLDRHYGVNVIFVFEGYKNGSSAKDHEYLRRSMGSSSEYPGVKNDLHL